MMPILLFFVILFTPLSGRAQTPEQNPAKAETQKDPSAITFNIPAISFEVRAGETPRLVPSLALATVGGCNAANGQLRKIKIPLNFDTAAKRIIVTPTSITLKKYMWDDPDRRWTLYDPGGLPSHLVEGGAAVFTKPQYNQVCTEKAVLQFYFNLLLPGTEKVKIEGQDTLLSEIADGKNFPEAEEFSQEGPVSFSEEDVPHLIDRIITLKPLHKITGKVVFGEDYPFGIIEQPGMPVWFTEEFSYTETVCLKKLAAGRKSITLFGSEPEKVGWSSWVMREIGNPERICAKYKKSLAEDRESSTKNPGKKVLKPALPQKKTIKLKDQAAETAGQLLGNGI